MTLILRSVADAGVVGKERLIMKATDDHDVGDYAVFQVNVGADGGLSTKTLHSFWFPYKLVKKDDLVVLYTKAGQPKEKLLENGQTAHFYYWGLKDVIWNDARRSAVLLHAPYWTSKPMSELSGK